MNDVYPDHSIVDSLLTIRYPSRGGRAGRGRGAAQRYKALRSDVLYIVNT